MRRGPGHFIAIALLTACSAVPDGSGSPALHLNALWESYQTYAGKEVIVEGFLIKQGRQYLLLQGARSPASEEVMDGSDRISYYCTFENQPLPMEVFGLRPDELHAIVKRVKHRPDNHKIEGQRVEIAATVQPVPPGTEGTSEIILPAEVTTSGSIKNARVVQVSADFCRGDKA